MSNVKELNVNNTTYDIIGKGVVDQNNPSTPLKQWSGTKAEYDLLTPDSNTLYNITDDTDPSEFADRSLSNLDVTGQAIIDSKVNKTGDTMTGTLEVDDASVSIKKTTFDSTTTTAPAEFTDLGTFGVFDENDKYTGYLQNSFRTDNVIRTQIGARRIIGGSNKNASLNLDVDSSGTASCTFPNSTCVDGQFINTTTSDINNNTNNAVGTYTFDASSVLPNDGQKYEVYIHAYGNPGSTSSICTVYSDIFSTPATSSSYAQLYCTASINASADFIIPVGSGRKIYYKIVNSDFNSLYLRIYGYRRIGTNT